MVNNRIVGIGIAVAVTARAATATAAPAPFAADALVKRQFTEWSATLASGGALTSAAALATSVFAPGAKFAVTGGLGLQDEVAPASAPSELFGNVVLAATVLDARVGVAADGSAAWITFSAVVSRTADTAWPLVTVRGTELVVKQGTEWTIAGGMMSIGHPDAEVNKAAAAGKLAALQPVSDAPIASADVAHAFNALIGTTGFSASDIARPDLVTVGSGPGELSVGGKAIGPYFNKAWRGRVKVIGTPLVIASPASRTVAGVLANVDLPGGTPAKPYALPFRWFVIFELGPDRAWHVVSLHLAVAAPR